jgi:hypothetical protein
MTWKQPIPTSITNLDTVTEIVLSYILLRLRKEDMTAPKEFWHGNKRHLVKLEKHQCVFAVERFCRETEISKVRVKKSLKILQNLQIDEKTHINMTINRRSFGLIITLQNGDEVLSMKHQSDNQCEINVKSNSNQSAISVTTSNKNDKKEETEKNEKTNYPFESFWDLYQRKGSKKVARDRYQKLTEAQRELIFQHVPKYQTSREKRYWKDAERYISHETWESEIVDNEPEEKLEDTKILPIDTLAKPSGTYPFDKNTQGIADLQGLVSQPLAGKAADVALKLIDKFEDYQSLNEYITFLGSVKRPQTLDFDKLCFTEKFQEDSLKHYYHWKKKKKENDPLGLNHDFIAPNLNQNQNQ